MPSGISGKIHSLLKGKKIAFLGLGLENEALIDFLLKYKISSYLTVCDFRSPKQLGQKYDRIKNKVAWRLQERFNQHLDGFDILFRSPGWPINCPGIKASAEHGVEITSAIRFFMDVCPSKRIIGVTGTKGKGTTATIIYKIIKDSRRRVWLGGNIGIAPFTFIEKIKSGDWVVLELSSFQLEDMRVSPQIAVMTNFSPEHLKAADPNNPNYHLSLAAYWRAKTNVFSHQKTKDHVVANIRLKGKINKIGARSNQHYVGKSELETILPGMHNLENIALAEEVAKIIKIGRPSVIKTVKNMNGLIHRLEYIRTVKGLKFYNDSFATIPEAAITALRSFRVPITIIVGGAEKGSDFSNLVKVICKKTSSVVFLNGEATPRLKAGLLKLGYPSGHTRHAYSMSQAVKEAVELSSVGSIVLLSPACASFGMFKNYKERGKEFTRIVNSLK